MLIDTHAHLTDERYGGAKEIIGSMHADGLEKIITVSYNLESAYRCAEIARLNKDVYCTAGIHPSDAQELTSDPSLDYFYPETDRDKQIYWLEKQLDVVCESGLPVCFHVRDAYEDMDRVLSRNADKLRNGVVMHCFSGSKETAQKYADMGFYISFSGSVTFKNAKKFYDIVPVVPLDRILIETDCPYLTPHPHRGETNYPRFVRFQAEKIAEILGLSFEEAEKITTDNAYRIFTKMKRD